MSLQLETEVEKMLFGGARLRALLSHLRCENFSCQHHSDKQSKIPLKVLCHKKKERSNCSLSPGATVLVLVLVLVWVPGLFHGLGPVLR